jgi:hypothetical protein
MKVSYLSGRTAKLVVLPVVRGDCDFLCFFLGYTVILVLLCPTTWKGFHNNVQYNLDMDVYLCFLHNNEEVL